MHCGEVAIEPDQQPLTIMDRPRGAAAPEEDAATEQNLRINAIMLAIGLYKASVSALTFTQGGAIRAPQKLVLRNETRDFCTVVKHHTKNAAILEKLNMIENNSRLILQTKSGSSAGYVIISTAFRTINMTIGFLEGYIYAKVERIGARSRARQAPRPDVEEETGEENPNYREEEMFAPNANDGDSGR